MQVKHNFSKCPKCGNNLEGIEDFCPECGHKLEGQTQQPQQPPPPPQDNQPAAPHKPPPSPPPPGKVDDRKKGGFPLWAIILIVVVVLGGAIGGYFLLKNQGMDSSKKQTEIQDTKNYYVCYSIAYIGGKQQVAVSNIIVATNKSQDMQWAKGLFKNALKKKFPSKHTKYKQVFAKNFNSMKGATTGSRKMKNDYDKKGYQVNTIRINY